MRQLATIQKIISIRPIEGADKIEVAQVLGWEVVVKKGEFNVGDLVCYMETDSIVPQIPMFEFLEERKYRVRIIKLRGQISQGLIIPIQSLRDSGFKIVAKEGVDITDILGIKKYDPQLVEEQTAFNTNHKKSKLFKFFFKFKVFRTIYFKFFEDKEKGFPSFIRKTDETRIQSIPSIIWNNQNRVFYLTEKLDGMSSSFWFNKGKFGFASRNINLSNSKDNAYFNIAKKYNIDFILKEYSKKHKMNIAIQGEIIGPKIQGNPYELKENEFYIFNVFNIDKNEYFQYNEIIRFIDETGLKLVPIIDTKKFIFSDVNSVVKESYGKSVLNTLKDREGLVFRSIDLPFTSFKVINPEFLLKEEKQ